MKNKMLGLLITVSFAMMSCSSTSQTYVNTTNKLGLTPEYDKNIREDAFDSMIANLPKTLPKVVLPPNTTDGEQA